ncbi:MAG: Glu/Leu/Phe/Val dehydrogenase [Calditrichaeota bacterium]|nr:MAG: Glu/Leu/Phe/Val dehydrogenase [Calditrichota bacterium]
MERFFQILATQHVERCFAYSEPRSGLQAFVVLDSLTLGPAAGGVRTRRYPSVQAALQDAMRLARTMTIKCALAGLDAGGGKAVVLDHDDLDRTRAFEKLGAFVEELGGIFRTAGDLGTTPDDLRAMARTTRFVHTNETDLAHSVALGVLRAAEACAEMRGLAGVRGLRVAVQGCGAVGAAVAHIFSQAGAEVLVADVVPGKAQKLAAELGAHTLNAEDILATPVDLLAPCAAGGVVTARVARKIKAWAICGAANNFLADQKAEQELVAREILCVPDVVSSAGAVIEGIGETLMGLPDRTPLIDRIKETTRKVLETAKHAGALPSEVAEEMARTRISEAQKKKSRN